jgi:hypothetical protein
MDTQALFIHKLFVQGYAEISRRLYHTTSIAALKMNKTQGCIVQPCTSSAFEPRQDGAEQFARLAENFYGWLNILSNS